MTGGVARVASRAARVRRLRSVLIALAVTGALLMLGACRGTPVQSALEAKGPLARNTEGLWWFAFWVAAGVYVLTIGALAWATATARRRAREGVLPATDGERRMTLGVAIASAATLAILLVFFVVDQSVGRTLRAPTAAERPLLIQVVGHQWWWEVTYPDSTPQHRMSTANEIHVPVGHPVLLELSSRDVIHSVWVPNVAGKKDMIPGYIDTLWFQADTPGVYRGQCAEFCGHQHAKMALEIVAQPRAEYERWIEEQRQQAAAPSDSAVARGEEVFLSGTCAMCHTVEGTKAASRAGPDLTHLASRRTIAAGTLPNTRGNLAGWIVDPQRVKPGAHMPPNMLAPADLEALLTYLQSLH
jgi:cytochrome c oxidase subunit II